jgi:hypothetical protein
MGGPGLSGVARRTLRTNLRFTGRRVVPQLYPQDMPLPRERAKAPYSPAEIAGYLALADAQPAPQRRMRAAGLICLGAGAGLIRADLRDVHGTDVTCRSGGVIVTVRGGARPRTVPVLARYHDRLLAAAASAGAGLVCGGTDPGRRNITTPLIRSLAGGDGLPRLDTSRLRATWLADVADLPGLAAFMHAAGITCSQRLGDLLAGLEPAAQAASTCQFHSAGRVSPGAVQGVAVSCGPRHRVVAPSLIPPRYLVASSCAAGVYRGMVHGPGGWGSSCWMCGLPVREPCRVKKVPAAAASPATAAE